MHTPLAHCCCLSNQVHFWKHFISVRGVALGWNDGQVQSPVCINTPFSHAYIKIIILAHQKCVSVQYTPPHSDHTFTKSGKALNSAKHHLSHGSIPSGRPPPLRDPGELMAERRVTLVTERWGCQDSLSPAVVLLFLLLIPEGPLSWK